MLNFILLLVLGAILAGAGVYLQKARRKGNRCIGCPASGCSKDCHCSALSVSK